MISLCDVLANDWLSRCGPTLLGIGGKWIVKKASGVVYRTKTSLKRKGKRIPSKTRQTNLLSRMDSTMNMQKSKLKPSESGNSTAELERAKQQKASRFHCVSCGSSFASMRGLTRHQHHQCLLMEFAGVQSPVDAQLLTPVSLLNSAAPFFINGLGQYQFNTNSSRQSINCPFCILHKTSIQGLAKHCSTNHRSQYLAWKAGTYGKVQLRRVPPDGTVVKKVLQTMKDAGLLDKDVPLTEAAVTPSEQLESTKRPKKPQSGCLKVKRDLPKETHFRRIQPSKAWAATEAPVGFDLPTPPPPPYSLPPPPPLIDCRNLAVNSDNGFKNYEVLAANPRLYQNIAHHEATFDHFRHSSHQHDVQKHQQDFFDYYSTHHSQFYGTGQEWQQQQQQQQPSFYCATTTSHYPNPGERQEFSQSACKPLRPPQPPPPPISSIQNIANLVDREFVDTSFFGCGYPRFDLEPRAQPQPREQQQPISSNPQLSSRYFYSYLY